jgi:hypothetical protein
MAYVIARWVGGVREYVRDMEVQPNGVQRPVTTTEPAKAIRLTLPVATLVERDLNKHSGTIRWRMSEIDHEETQDNEKGQANTR